MLASATGGALVPLLTAQKADAAGITYVLTVQPKTVNVKTGEVGELYVFAEWKSARTGWNDLRTWGNASLTATVSGGAQVSKDGVNWSTSVTQNFSFLQHVADTFYLKSDTAGAFPVTLSANGIDTLASGSINLSNTAELVVTDPVLPTVNLISPANGSVSNNSSVTFEWEGVPGDYPIAQYTLETYLNGSLYLTTNIDGGSTSYALGSLAEGNWEWRVRAFDANSNPGPWSDTRAFTIDKSMPLFAITNPVNGSVVSGTQTITAEITDASGIKKVLMTLPTKSGNKTYVYEEGAANNSLTKSGDTYSVTVDTKELFNDGVVYAVLRATDNASNTRYWNNNANNRQHNFTVDNTRPKTVLFTPVDGQLTNGTFTISGTASDANGIEKVLITIGRRDTSGTFAGYVLENVEANWDGTNFTYEVTGLPEFDGTYYVRAKAYDAAGNNHSAGADGVIVDTTAPIIEINGTTPKGAYKMNESINVHIIDDNFDRVEIDRIDSAAPDDDKHWTYYGEWFGLWWLQDGTYRLTAYDKAGNTTTHEFITDETRPIVTGSDEPTRNPVSFTITATDNSSGIQRITGNIYKYDPTHPNADAEGYYLFKSNSSTTENPFAVFLDSLDEGKYYVKYNAQDVAGNISNTEKFYFTVDHTTPSEDTDTEEDSTLNQGGQTQGAFTANGQSGQSNEGQAGNENQNNAQTDSQTAQEDEAVNATLTSSDEAEVQGASTELVENAASTNGGKFLGLGWWWLAILAALAFLWLVFGRRTAEDKN